MSIADTLREHGSGMLADLAFAVVWVTGVSVFFDFVTGPQWAYYLFMAAGIPAYFGFFWSLKMAREQQ
ncbi:hypothetical protein [Halopelagius longus]|uniref:DUF8119 domain-containing protein n=1 Tax=Halopelagius longus TaxID=1236180 RepID=A0A1H0YM30_9EURY|nr:hypothetical protein [Halopelagius longus]RDI72560.1 hypothetical protein DWB78_12995 [Halopelagius longus]SDQ16130.1 hypothetical protein SAMN05216278_0715 [Halopelagius longus]